jgi:hypothetical protein
VTADAVNPLRTRPSHASRNHRQGHVSLIMANPYFDITHLTCRRGTNASRKNNGEISDMTCRTIGQDCSENGRGRQIFSVINGSINGS